MQTARSFITLVKGAKRIEWIAFAAALAVLLMLLVNTYTTPSTAGTETEMETRVAQALARVDGAGRVRVLIGDGASAGVLVVAEGADDIRVALALSRAVSTLLDVPNDRIEVLKMDGGG